MTYYDQENQFLRQRLQKEIPILTALIQNLYQELDRKFHLNGAKIPVTFGFETDSLGSYTSASSFAPIQMKFPVHVSCILNSAINAVKIGISFCSRWRKNWFS